MSYAAPEKWTILLVEDDRLVLGAVRAVLEAQGCAILPTGSAAEALQVCETHPGPIHLLLTDVVMPGPSGRVVADRLTAMHPETRVLYMSGYTEDAIVHHGMLEEGIAFIPKPFTPASIAHAVRVELDGALGKAV